MASADALLRFCRLLLTVLLPQASNNANLSTFSFKPAAAADETSCTWSSRIIDAEASIINITVPIVGQCQNIVTNNDFFFVINETFVGMRRRKMFPYLLEEVKGVSALRILIHNAEEVDYFYLFCENNGNRYAITVARNNYTARINAIKESLTNEIRESSNETDITKIEGILKMESNLNILTTLQNTRPINEDFCEEGDNVSMKWTFPRGQSGVHKMACRSSEGHLCSIPQNSEDIDLCDIEEDGEFYTYSYTARRSKEGTVIYNCVLNGNTILTKIVHWNDPR